MDTEKNESVMLMEHNLLTYEEFDHELDEKGKAMLSSCPERKDGRPMTGIQKKFVFGIHMLDRINRAAECEWTEKLRQDKDQVIMYLFSLVEITAKHQANEIIKHFDIPSDAVNDIYQNVFMVFMEKLPDYDPAIAAPSTYYAPYFKQAVMDYLIQETEYTAYDIQNIRKTLRAIGSLENKEITDWSAEMLCAETELSLRVIKHALRDIDHLQIRECPAEDIKIGKQSVDPAYMNKEIHTCNPEDKALRNIESEEICNAIRNTLSEEERDFFLYMLNLADRKKRTFKEVSAHYGITIKTAKLKYLEIICKLFQNDYFKGIRRERLELIGATADRLVGYKPTDFPLS